MRQLCSTWVIAADPEPIGRLRAGFLRAISPKIPAPSASRIRPPKAAALRFPAVPTAPPLP